jgi:hypothetical protein
MVCTAAGQTIFVDADASTGGDGTTWGTAYKYLQDALSVAGDGNDIWVADGTYNPDANSTYPDGAGNRNATFQLKNGVGLYGGFAGGETSLDERDWQTNETILSGDLNGDDGPYFANNDENSFHVVTGSGTDDTAVLDGFTITAGNAYCNDPSSRGGGMYNDNGSPTLSNCTFSENNANVSGGGMYNYFQSNPTLTNCTFTGNTAPSGGGMHNRDGSAPMLTGCSFSDNLAGWAGGGMANLNSNPTLTNCLFSGNTAEYGGGGMKNLDSDPNVTNCTFSGNSADSRGGGMYNEDSNPTLTNCVFCGNEATIGSGGGIWNSFSDLNVTNCTFSGNKATIGSGGGMYNYYSSPTVTGCSFSGNTAEYDGGGMCNYDNSPTVTNCILWGDTASDGNEIALKITSIIDVNYCDVQSGKAGIYNDGTCTINWGSSNIDQDPNFVDANGLDGIAGTEDDNLRLSHGSPCIDVGDNEAVPFDTADLDGDGNTVEPIPWDLDGRPRISDGDCNDSNIVDMGAYEFREPACYLWEGQTQAEYDYWVGSGKPECWCYPRQCHGDANGKKQGSFIAGYWYVGSDDLDIMSLGWMVKEPPHGPGILGLELNGVPVACADFAHDKQGNVIMYSWRIGSNDLDEMSLYWLVKEPPKGPGTPADCQPGNRTP